MLRSSFERHVAERDTKAPAPKPRKAAN